MFTEVSQASLVPHSQALSPFLLQQSLQQQQQEPQWNKYLIKAPAAKTGIMIEANFVMANTNLAPPVEQQLKTPTIMAIITTNVGKHLQPFWQPQLQSFLQQHISNSLF